MSTASPPAAAPGSDAPLPQAPSPPTSKNPLTTLSSLDPSKKYTLVFLVSVGTTLLLTGASGGRLLKRAKAASSSTPAAAEAPPAAASPLKAASKLNASLRPPVVAAAPAPSPPPPPPSALGSQLFASPTSLSSPASSSRLLKSFRSATPSGATAYFLPNSLLLSSSTTFAEGVDQADKLHRDGSLEDPEHPDNGFNPAVYAAKAFGIATALVVGVFGAATWGVMRWYDVNDLESLSLALSHSVPQRLDSTRPSLPEWALPAPKAPVAPGQEEENEEHKEGVAYWLSVKETLDREAEEQKRIRREKWETMRERRQV